MVYSSQTTQVATNLISNHWNQSH